MEYFLVKIIICVSFILFLTINVNCEDDLETKNNYTETFVNWTLPGENNKLKNCSKNLRGIIGVWKLWENKIVAVSHLK